MSQSSRALVSDDLHSGIGARRLPIPLLSALLVACVAASPLFVNQGFLNTRSGGDSPFLLFRLHQLYAALNDGVFPVRWMPDAAFGLGYPFFNFYAALPFYVAAGFKALGFPYVMSLKLTHLFGFLLAAAGVYYWIKQITDHRGAAVLGSIVYTFAPFHLVNVYVRGDSLAEFWAMAWYPWIFLSLLKASRDPRWVNAVWIGLAFGALVMTHNVSALISAPFIAAYACGSAIATDRQQTILRLGLMAGGGLLGLALAAWVWLPALAETDWVQLSDQTTGYFFYGEHFRSADLVQPTFFFSYDAGNLERSPFSMGLIQALLTAGGVVAAIVYCQQNRRWWQSGFLIAGWLLATFMITPLSSVVWQYVPLLPYAQFPWRFLSLQALFGAALIAFLAAFPVTDGAQKYGSWLSRSVTVVASVGLATGIAALGHLQTTFVPISDAEITPERLRWYEAFTGNIGTTIRYEYLPRWVYPRPYTSDILLGRAPRAKFLEGSGQARQLEADSAAQLWWIESHTGTATVALPLLYYPGWQAEMDRQPVPIRPLEGLGYIQLDVPEGGHYLRLRFGRTPLRAAAEIVSLVAFVVAGYTISQALYRAGRLGWMERALLAGAITSIIVIGMVLASLPDLTHPDGLLNADFGQHAYFYPLMPGIPISDQTFLTGIEQRGPRFIVLNWRVDPPRSIERVSLYLVPPPQQAAIGASEAAILKDISVYTDRNLIMLPDGPILTGLYFLQLRDQGGSAFETKGRGSLYLQPFIIGDRDDVFPVGTPVDLQFGPVRLLSADEILSQPERLQIRLFWGVETEVSQNYAISLRLRDQAGREQAVLDTQAGGGGMFPTGLWIRGNIVPDTYTLSLPYGTPPGSYILETVLYDARTLDPVGMATIPGIDYTSASVFDCLKQEFTDLLPGFGYADKVLTERITEREPITVAIDWVVCKEEVPSVLIEWSLDGPATWTSDRPAPFLPSREDIDDRPQEGMLLRSQFELLVPELEPGIYSLSFRLLNKDGEILSEEVLGDVELDSRSRTFRLPPLDREEDVVFGDQIRLWGYSLMQSNASISLDVVWGAHRNPEKDYRFFVHLFDPATEQIVAQVDAMPRGFTYPTALWLEGEVVEDTIMLPLDGVAPGRYQIAIGWYDESARLPVQAGGEQLPDARLILREDITIP